MHLSPREEAILANLEEELRTGDPELAAALSAEPPFTLPVGHVLHLVGALVTLVGAVVVFGDRISGLGVAVLTGALVVPWLVRTAMPGRAVPRRRRHAAGDAARRSRRSTGIVTIVVVLAAAALVPPSWRAPLGLIVMFVVLPSILLRAAQRSGHREQPHGRPIDGADA